MRIPSLRTAAIVLVAGIGLSGCTTYDPYGYGGVSVGYSSGYSPYGYGSPYGHGYDSSYGYGSGYGYGSPYGYGSGYGYGGGYGSLFGWYDGFYYPGTGYYVYDSNRRRHVWNDRQRHHWDSVRSHGTSTATATSTGERANWTGFGRDQQVRARGDRSGQTRTQSSDRSARAEHRQQVRDTATTTTDSSSGERRHRRDRPN